MVVKRFLERNFYILNLPVIAQTCARGCEGAKNPSPDFWVVTQ